MFFYFVKGTERKECHK